MLEHATDTEIAFYTDPFPGAHTERYKDCKDKLLILSQSLETKLQAHLVHEENRLGISVFGRKTATTYIGGFDHRMRNIKKAIEGEPIDESDEESGNNDKDDSGLTMIDESN